ERRSVALVRPGDRGFQNRLGNAKRRRGFTARPDFFRRRGKAAQPAARTPSLVLRVEARTDRTRSGGSRKTLRVLPSGPAADRGRNQRALRVRSGTVAGDRGCVQEVRLRVHGEDGGETAAAPREELGGRVFIGASDRGQSGRSSAGTPAG